MNLELMKGANPIPHLEMYRIPGCPEVSPEHYLKSKERYEKKIEQIAMLSPIEIPRAYYEKLVAAGYEDINANEEIFSWFMQTLKDFCEYSINIPLPEYQYGSCSARNKNMSLLLRRVRGLLSPEQKRICASFVFEYMKSGEQTLYVNLFKSLYAPLESQVQSEYDDDEYDYDDSGSFQVEDEEIVVDDSTLTWITDQYVEVFDAAVNSGSSDRIQEATKKSNILGKHKKINFLLDAFHKMQDSETAYAGSMELQFADSEESEKITEALLGFYKKIFAGNDIDLQIAAAEVPLSNFNDENAFDQIVQIIMASDNLQAREKFLKNEPFGNMTGAMIYKLVTEMIARPMSPAELRTIIEYIATPQIADESREDILLSSKKMIYDAIDGGNDHYLKDLSYIMKFFPDNEKAEIRSYAKAKCAESIKQHNAKAFLCALEFCKTESREWFYIDALKALPEAREEIIEIVRSFHVIKLLVIATMALESILEAKNCEKFFSSFVALDEPDSAVSVAKLLLIHNTVQSRQVAYEMLDALAAEDGDGLSIIQDMIAEMYERTRNGEEFGDDKTRHASYVELLPFMRFARPEIKKQVLVGVASTGNINKLVESVLYQKNPDITNNSFKRASFAKGGSETTLVGGPLKDSIIIRHITPEAFHYWKLAYEAVEIWKKHGFNYIPVEPIESFSLNKNNLVDVYTRVLDCDIKTWLQRTGVNYDSLLAQQYQKLEKVLEEIGIDHGHFHTANVCLRFYRDEHGDAQVQIPPRLYIIDFDMALRYDPSIYE